MNQTTRKPFISHWNRLNVYKFLNLTELLDVSKMSRGERTTVAESKLLDQPLGFKLNIDLNVRNLDFLADQIRYAMKLATSFDSLELSNLIETDKNQQFFVKIDDLFKDKPIKNLKINWG